jgi:predicted nucleic acid-binding Zn ribbon protein
VKRVIQKPLIAFKGEGFHINDYAPKTGEAAPAPSRATSESTPSSAGNDSGTAKTEPHSN